MSRPRLIWDMPDWETIRLTTIDSERWGDRPSSYSTAREQLKRELRDRELERRLTIARSRREKRERRRAMWQSYRPVVYTATGLGLLLLGLVAW